MNESPEAVYSLLYRSQLHIMQVPIDVRVEIIETPKVSFHSYRIGWLRHKDLATVEGVYRFYYLFDSKQIVTTITGLLALNPELVKLECGLALKKLGAVI